MNPIQSNKLPNKSIKYAKILFQIKQMQNTGFEITFDTFDTGYEIGDLTCSADKCLFIAYPEPGECLGSGSGQSEPSLIHPLVSYPHHHS
jgi:hypothetical protein